MRLYGQRFVSRAVDRYAQNRTETRDAVLWEIDEGNYRCKVKIQGSAELVVAHYPRNWKQQPYWLKVGNAVRVLHRSGVRGYVEVIGEGRAIPTPVTGGGSALPPLPCLPDGIISGLTLSPTEPASLCVLITAGWYRISCDTYFLDPDTLEYITMDDPAPMVMGSGDVMGIGSYTICIDPVPAEGYYRYDTFAVGTDRVIDYIKGTEARTSPVKPAIPSDHVQIGSYIFVRWNMTTITQQDIGTEWSNQRPTELRFTLQYTPPTPFPWNEYDDTPEMNVTVTVYDQYGVVLPTGSPGYLLVLTKLIGEGQIYSATTGWDEDEVQQSCYSSYTFKYQRDQLASEISPVSLQVVCDAHNLINAAIIILEMGI